MSIPIPPGSFAPSGLPVSHAPPPPILERSKFSDVNWWTAKDWKTHISSAGDFVVIKKSKSKSAKVPEENDDEQESDDASDEERVNVLGFLEHADGTTFSEEERDFARQCAREYFQTFLVAGLAPVTFSQSSLEVMTYFRNNMVEKIPALAYCQLGWKVDTLGTEVYAQWSRYRKSQLRALKEDTTTSHSDQKSKKRKIKDNSTDKNNKTGKRIKLSNAPEPPSKRKNNSTKTAASPPLLDLTELIPMPDSPPDEELLTVPPSASEVNALSFTSNTPVVSPDSPNSDLPPLPLVLAPAPDPIPTAAPASDVQPVARTLQLPVPMVRFSLG